jgi:nitrite reductase/ring-hydroxylating ferredoxin subunit
MGLRDRILNKAKSVLGKPETKSSNGLNAAGLPNAMSADGYRAVAKSEAVKEGGAGTFGHPSGRVAAVFRKDGKLYCIDNECRHEDGPVGEGKIEGCKVQCPYHDWEYDFTTGICTAYPENRLETYSVREKDGFIWLGPQLTPGTSMRGGEHNDGMKVIVK